MERERSESSARRRQSGIGIVPILMVVVSALLLGGLIVYVLFVSPKPAPPASHDPVEARPCTQGANEEYATPPCALERAVVESNDVHFPCAAKNTTLSQLLLVGRARVRLGAEGLERQTVCRRQTVFAENGTV